ncbi:MAG: 50S ribosomal protein L9 [Myxococcales bacterium]|nr:50S ribosomal protein L9 [Myxococcales bacterium]
MMKIILQEDVPNLGVVGDLVTVKDGYARNFLIPQGKAVFASVRSVSELEHQKRIADHRRRLARADAEVAKERIEKLAITLEAKVAPAAVDEDGKPLHDKLPKLFGSITNRDLARVLRESGVQVEHRRIVLPQPVRTVGRFTAKARLDGGVAATVTFWVLPEGTSDIEAEKKRVEEAQKADEDERLAAVHAAQAAEQQARQVDVQVASEEVDGDSTDAEDEEAPPADSKKKKKKG